jgi:hypothetical protein
MRLIKNVTWVTFALALVTPVTYVSSTPQTNGGKWECKMNVRTKPDLFTKPDWAKAYERKCDISDIWIDEIDLENADGKFVEAFLLQDIDGQLFVHGISVKCELATTYYERVGAVVLLGLDGINHIEALEMEATL